MAKPTKTKGVRFDITRDDARMLASEIMTRRSQAGCSLSDSQRFVFSSHYPRAGVENFGVWLSNLQSVLSSIPGRKRGRKAIPRGPTIGYRPADTHWGPGNEPARLSMMVSVAAHLRVYVYLHGYLPPLDVISSEWGFGLDEALAGLEVLRCMGFTFDMGKDPQHTVIAVLHVPTFQRATDSAMVFALHYKLRPMASASGNIPMSTLESYQRDIGCDWTPENVGDIPACIADVSRVLAEAQSTAPMPKWMEAEPPT